MTDIWIKSGTLQFESDEELWRLITEAHRIMAERRENNIATETAALNIHLVAAQEAVVPIQAEYDAATLPIKRRVIMEKRLQPALDRVSEIQSQIERLQWKYPPTHGGPIA